MLTMGLGKSPAQKGEIALAGSCKQNLACCDACKFITFPNVLSDPRIVFLSIYLCDFSFSFFFYYLQSPYSSWFQWTLSKSADDSQLKCPALILDPSACCVFSYSLFLMRINIFAFLTHKETVSYFCQRYNHPPSSLGSSYWNNFLILSLPWSHQVFPNALLKCNLIWPHIHTLQMTFLLLPPPLLCSKTPIQTPITPFKYLFTDISLYTGIYTSLCPL